MASSSPLKPDPAAVKSQNTDPFNEDDADIDMVASLDPNTQLSTDPASDEVMKGETEVRQEALDLNLEEARIPLRKDVSLREFLSKMDDYAPIVRR